MELLYAKVSENAVPPSQRPDSVGWDCFAYGDHVLSPGETRIIPLGWHAALPPGFAAFVWDRSSFGANGIHVFHQMITNPPHPENNVEIVPFGGVIDWSYRGQWGVILHSFLAAPLTIKHGNRIAQFVIQRVEEVTLTEITMEELDKIPSRRGAKGLGSSEGKTPAQAQAEIKAGKSNATP